MKLGVALTAAVLVGAEVLGRRPGRFGKAALVLCAVVAAVAYFQPALGRGGAVHRWEMFHYYLGAKYQPELGYERLYACVTEADIADGIQNARARRVRDLHTDQLTTGAEAVARAGSCERALGGARFDAFHADVKTFRRVMGSRRLWERLLEDHGYNPPPLWTLVGRGLASLHAPTRGFLTLLAGFDFLLMGGAVSLFAWGFGLRVSLLAVIFWGTQAPAEWSWVGGGFLRQDWLFCSVLGLALLRRGRPAWGGAALVLAALLRLFPAVLLVGAGVVMLSATWRRRSLSDEHARLALGGLVTAALLFGLSSAVLGADSYARFWEHIQLRTGVVSNHMGLRTLFAYSPSASLTALSDPSLLDPTAPWTAARAARLASLGLAYRVTAAGVVLLLIFAAWRARSAWLGVALSLPLIPALTEPSCYYYSVWVLALPLARARPAVGVTLLGVAAAGQLLGLRYAAYDELYFALALLYVGSALVLLVSFTESPLVRFRAFRARRARPLLAPHASAAAPSTSLGGVTRRSPELGRTT